MLEQFITMVVMAHRNGVSIVAIRLSLTKEGMSEDEVSMVIDIIALEVRMQAIQVASLHAYKVSSAPRKGIIIDMVG